MKRTQIQLHSEQVEWLKQHALKKGTSMSHVIRESVDAYRSKVEKIRRLNLQREYAIDAVGRFSSQE
jgi:Arc/MetJ-type ribon-helix-helix transcriptional regulator